MKDRTFKSFVYGIGFIFCTLMAFKSCTSVKYTKTKELEELKKTQLMKSDTMNYELEKIKSNKNQ